MGSHVRGQAVGGEKQNFSFREAYPQSYVDNLGAMHRIKIPRPIRVLSWILAMGMISTVLVLVFVPWVQTSEGMGRVSTMYAQDRVQTINAQVPGLIAEWYVREGDPVTRGDPIVLIRDVDNELVVRLQAQLDAAIRKLAATREAVATARIDYDRRQQLFEEGLTSRFDYEQARIRVQQMLVSEEEAAAAVNEAQVSLSRQGSQLVVAPRDGTILSLQAGDTATFVSSGQSIATFMPANTQRAVELFIDGRDIGLVRPGRQVRLQFEGWPSVQFSGMPDFAIGTFAGEVVFVEPSARLDGRFRVLVTEKIVEEDCRPPTSFSFSRVAGNCGWPPESFVRLGASTRGWILMETVPLGFELWRLLNNFPPLNDSPLQME